MITTYAVGRAPTRRKDDIEKVAMTRWVQTAHRSVALEMWKAYVRRPTTEMIIMMITIFL